MIIAFFILLFFVLYPYFIYPVLVLVLSKVIPRFKVDSDSENLPNLTLLIAAYNEEDLVDWKVKNCRKINYPKDRLSIVFVTSGSNDKTVALLSKYDDIIVYHKDKREGKTAAIIDAMPNIKTEITVYNDMNTDVAVDALIEIGKYFNDPRIGGVSGEKKVIQMKDAISNGEGLYWRYESKVKEWETEFNNVMGAPGELFAIRTKLFRIKEKTIVNDDFVISFDIINQGYFLEYEPNAYTKEYSSASLKDEFTRKLRITSAGIQSIKYVKQMMNPFKGFKNSFQFISHKIMRWTVTPISILLIFPVNYLLIYNEIFKYLFFGQVVFYLLATLGLIGTYLKIEIKLFFIPFYFMFMNYTALFGFIRQFFVKPNSKWKKSARIKTA